MSTPKPIFIAKQYISFQNLETSMEVIEQIRNTQESLQKRMPDYHIMIIPILKNEVTKNCDVEFECFYPDKLDTKNFEEFKEQILNEFKIKQN